MFVILKLIKPFLLPPTLIAVAWVIGLLLTRQVRWRRWAMRILIAATAAYVLLSLEPVAYFLAWSLERNVRAPDDLASGSPHAIVVLAGGADEPEGRRTGTELGGSSWRRLWAGVEAYRAYNGAVPIVYAGGPGDPFHTTSTEGITAQQIAGVWGVPNSAMLLETASRDTYENGVAVRNLLRARSPDVERPTVVLVTSAWHMPRAMGVFQGLGMDTVPFPADYHTSDYRLSPLHLLPSTSAFATSVESIHEWIGMFGYWARGRT